MVIKPFKFWCQTVLPTVYDDSLSYYELLCKVVRKLNETISVTNATSNGFAQLTDFVNNYFANLDVQNEIDNKLDKMVENGTLDTIINENIFNELNNKINTVTSAYIYVKMFGAKGDGVTDDTRAIKRAIESGSGAIIFSPGVYLISETINLPQTKYSSIILNNATIKQTVRLSPMLKIGSDDSANYPMSVSGNGIIDMDNLGGIGIQVTNNAQYSHIDDIQVRNCSNGIGVLLGSSLDGRAVSLQCELNNVKIYGEDSREAGVGLHVNAYDCIFTNLFLYLCKTGCETLHGGHFFSYVHVWGHAYENYTKEQYLETVGFNLRGSSSFGHLYIDSVAQGVVTNGYDININQLQYANDITYDFNEVITDKIIVRGVWEKVIIGSALLPNPRNNTIKVKIFDIQDQSNFSAISSARNCCINHMIVNTEKYDVLDESFNTAIQPIRKTLFPSSAPTGNTYYLLGYVKSVAGTVKIMLERKYTFRFDVMFKCDQGALTKLKSEVVFPASAPDDTHLFYGEPITRYGVSWVPIYIKWDADKGSLILTVDAEITGECGFYSCFASSIGGLPQFTDTTGVVLTEIPLTT